MDEKGMIEKGVPIPGKYPFSEMEVGDSFTICLRQALSVRSMFRRYPPKRFISRTENDNSVRVWRVE